MSDDLIKRLREASEPNLKRWTKDKKGIEVKVNGKWKQVIKFRQE